MASGTLVLLPLAVLLGGIALQALLAGVLSARAKGWLAFASGVGALVAVLAAWPLILAGEAIDVKLGGWDGPLQLAYHVDGLGFFFALMGAGIGSAVLLYAVSYMEHEKGTTRFYALVLVFIAGLINLVYCADLFLLYASWELVGLCSFLLVSFWYKLPDAAYGARKVLTITHLAGYGLFAAVVLLHVQTGSTLWTDPQVQAQFSTGIFVLILIAALAKSVQFPLHTWIPNAMAAPTPVSALLHAACYVKAGVYLVARMHSFGPWPEAWGAAVSWVGAATLIIGALFMLAQKDLKKLLAFSTVSQIGYMMLGLGLGTPLGIAAGLLHCLNHGLFKGGLFLCAGAVQHACGTRDMDQLGGLMRRMPRTFAVWATCAAGIAGVPLLNGFASKWLIYNAALEANQPLLALVPWLGSILTVFAFLKATSGVFLGDEGPATGKAHEASWSMVTGAGVLAAGCVVLGVAPQLAITYLVNPLLPALGGTQLVGVGWFGLAVGQGAWFATAGLVLGVAALVVGGLVYGLPARVGGAVATAGGPPTVFTGGEPLRPQGRLGASDFSQVVKGALGPFYHVFDADRYLLWAWRAAGRFAALVNGILGRAEKAPVALLFGLAAAVAGASSFFPPAQGAAGHQAVTLVPLAAGIGLSAFALLLACSAAPVLRPLIVPLGLAGGLATGAAIVPAGLLRTGLLEAAAVIALLVLWRKSQSTRARRAYLAAIILSGLGMFGGALAAEHGNGQLALALLLPGVAIKLGLVPLWFWLPLVAESVPAVVAGLVIAIVDVAAFGEVLTLRGHASYLFDNPAPWLALGVASSVVGALLALAQKDIRRLLAFSTIQDMGLLVIALVLGGTYGIGGAVIGATVHAVAKALLFASVAGPEADGEALVNPRGLATRHPVAMAGFVVGALAVLGVPPTLGFAAHWRIFAAASGDLPLFAALCGAAMLSVATYARAIAVFWWGEAPAQPAPAVYNRPLLSVTVILLVLALLAAGVWPAVLGGVA